jgi:hypothetical protein
MHYVPPVRVVANVDAKSLRLLALLALWLRPEKATSAQ